MDMGMIFKRKQDNFLRLINEQTALTLKGVELLAEYMKTCDPKIVSDLTRTEKEADEIRRILIEELNKTFITPIDREDIHALTMRLDDIVDMINTIVSRMRIYNITGVDKNLVEFAQVIEESVKAVAQAIGGLRNIKNVKAVFDACVEVNRLENVGDTMRDRMLMELFENHKDPIAVIKWKDIYQDAETVLDVCEDVANIIDSIMVKQA